jgi:hypothetical protein
VVGLFSERLHLRARDFEGSEETDAVRSLAAMRDERVQRMAWHQEFGNNITGLYRMRGNTHPFEQSAITTRRSAMTMIGFNSALSRSARSCNES